jgi:hypothetical protein
MLTVNFHGSPMTYTSTRNKFSKVLRGTTPSDFIIIVNNNNNNNNNDNKYCQSAQYIANNNANKNKVCPAGNSSI